MIILSYQGPNFTDIRAVKLAPGLDASEYIQGLPDGSCGVRVEILEDLALTSWAVMSKAYSALADKPVRFNSIDEQRDALFALLGKVAEPIDVLPKPSSKRYKADTEPMDGLGGTNGATTRPKRAPVEDKWSGMDVVTLAAEAKRQGYKGSEAGNQGLLKMRLLNWLRSPKR